MHFSLKRVIIHATRSRYLRRKTGLFVAISFMIFLLCNYVALICHIALPSDSIQDTIMNIDSSWLSSGIGMNNFNDSTKRATTITNIENSTSAWKEILKNKTSPSRIGIHILRPAKPATNVVVLGERHSGTTFFTKYLSDCFPDANVQDTFVNNKHWLQHDPEYVDGVVSEDLSGTPSLWRDIANHDDEMVVEYPQKKHQKQSTNHYFKDSMVVVLFRNPYDW